MNRKLVKLKYLIYVCVIVRNWHLFGVWQFFCSMCQLCHRGSDSYGWLAWPGPCCEALAEHRIIDGMLNKSEQYARIGHHCIDYIWLHHVTSIWSLCWTILVLILGLSNRAVESCAQDAEIHLGVDDPHQGWRCRSSSMNVRCSISSWTFASWALPVEITCLTSLNTRQKCFWRAWPLLPAASSSLCVS